ncbi:hypothetical protein G6K93_32350 [Agrobacterium rhizogenes]|uniref:hypothetical protein n=1 Tax=Rhizobium rhizogenes TaxID=359 RepID=UPI001574E244|nr:hypothetical protein [Rhizobium rhizogenes]NTF52801.1 hypothetical protein [Rhizobium rhizogenes]NTF59503.1 hypothetical protein [Rhizobium rhizogenes]NTF79063.1 hypothetical protein [Rhizobium rhizogenes]NTG04720.1 hypothetical protein [Rhizobium rhizogenes]NTG18294.1 hypothetical protein [Rhizobium rhizogenes]
MPPIFLKAVAIGLMVIGPLIAAVELAAAQASGDGWSTEEAPPLYWGRLRDEPPATFGPLPHSNDICSPEDALRRARDYGLNGPAIERFSSRWVYVGGLREGNYDQVILKNTPAVRIPITEASHEPAWPSP